MGAAALYASNDVTGALVSPEVTIPANVESGYVLVIISAPISPLNIFDISLNIEVFEEGAWRVRDTNLFERDLVNGPLEAVNISIDVQIPRWAGKKVRAVFNCGQSHVAISINARW